MNTQKNKNNKKCQECNEILVNCHECSNSYCMQCENGDQCCECGNCVLCGKEPMNYCKQCDESECMDCGDNFLESCEICQDKYCSSCFNYSLCWECDKKVCFKCFEDVDLYNSNQTLCLECYEENKNKIIKCNKCNIECKMVSKSNEEFWNKLVCNDRFVMAKCSEENCNKIICFNCEPNKYHQLCLKCPGYSQNAKCNEHYKKTDVCGTCKFCDKLLSQSKRMLFH